MAGEALHTLEAELAGRVDTPTLRAQLAAGGSLVVVGGGFIGAEVASSARSLGLDVTVVEALPTPLAGPLGTSMGAAVAGLIRCVVEGVPDAAQLVGIGISVPGLVRSSDGLIRLATNLEWHDVSFGGIVLAALGLDVPVSIANDADLGALSEHVRGVA